MGPETTEFGRLSLSQVFLWLGGEEEVSEWRVKTFMSLYAGETSHPLIYGPGVWRAASATFLAHSFSVHRKSTNIHKLNAMIAFS